MNKSEFELFLGQAKSILDKEKVQKNERFKRGECYNIFEILGIETDEVLTHSTIISHLLDPNASHGCGDECLKLFLSQLSIFSDWRFSTKNVKIEVEYNIGHISNNNESGGRLDILIESHDAKKAIIIENKIYANDQYKQLLRYYNYAERKYGKGNYKILYLTLYGTEPSEESIKGSQIKLKNEIEQQDFYCVSYAVDIIQWLEKCLEKSATKAVLRETLVQYILILKKLTNLSMENKTKQELIEVCCNPKNIESLVWLRQNFENIVNQYMKDKFHPQLEEIAEKGNYRLEIREDGKDWLNTKWMCFSFIKVDSDTKQDEWNDFQISFEFGETKLRKLNCGFQYKKGRRSENVYNELSKIPNGKKTETYPFYRKCLAQDWLNQECFEKISNGQLAKDIEEELNKLYELIPEGIKL